MLRRVSVPLIAAVVGAGLPIAVLAGLAGPRTEARAPGAPAELPPATCGTREVVDCRPPIVTLAERTSTGTDELAHRVQRAWQMSHSRWCAGCDGQVVVKAPAGTTYGRIRPLIADVRQMEGVRSIWLAIDKDAGE